MRGRDTIVVGASAGGVEALQELVRRLPPDFNAALLVVLHMPADASSALPQILARTGRLPAAHAQDGEPIRAGRIYVAPPDYHLTVWDGRVRVQHGPREHGHRPAVDTLFRSAAAARGVRVIGVILSGTREDGTAGLLAVKRRGGLAVVQDPADALYPGMPSSALANVPVDHRVPVAQLAGLLVQLTQEQAAEGSGESGENPMTDLQEREAEYVERQRVDWENGNGSAQASSLTCPSCGGALWEIQEENLLRFRCHVGHSFSAESLMGEQANALEYSLWAAVRALREQAALLRRLATRARGRKAEAAATRYEERASEAEAHTARIAAMLLDGVPVQPPTSPNGPEA